MYVGVGARRVRDLFKEAREQAPSIIFIDELDSVGRRRAGSGPGNVGSAEEQGQALNQLLAEIDGFSPAQGVIVVGATNRPDVLDPGAAAARPLRPRGRPRAARRARPAWRSSASTRAASRSPPDVDLASIARADGRHDRRRPREPLQRGRAAHRARAAHSRSCPRTSRSRSSASATRPSASAGCRCATAASASRFLHGERVTFADVAGIDHVIDELAEVREYLADRKRFEGLGARVPMGFLLAGPPGTGKTLLAHALAGESNAAFISVAATEFNETYIGEGAARVRDLFAQARGVAPAIVFIDEIDSIGGHRGVGNADNSERAQTLNQLLIELDALRPQQDDGDRHRRDEPSRHARPGARRGPGASTASSRSSMPDLEARKRDPRAARAQDADRRDDVDLDALARLTFGLSGADLANLLNEAALLARAARRRAHPPGAGRGRARPRRRRHRQRAPAVGRGSPRRRLPRGRPRRSSRGRCRAGASCTRSASSRAATSPA